LIGAKYLPADIATVEAAEQAAWTGGNA
jgi:hypothetical protein